MANKFGSESVWLVVYQNSADIGYPVGSVTGVYADEEAALFTRDIANSELPMFLKHKCYNVYEQLLVRNV